MQKKKKITRIDADQKAIYSLPLVLLFKEQSSYTEVHRMWFHSTYNFNMEGAASPHVLFFNSQARK